MIEDQRLIPGCACKVCFRQGRQFLKLGNPNGALQCYENRIVVFPKDIAAMSNFAVCLKRAGHKEMADQVFAKARRLYDSMEKAGTLPDKKKPDGKITKPNKTRK